MISFIIENDIKIVSKDPKFNKNINNFNNLKWYHFAWYFEKNALFLSDFLINIKNFIQLPEVVYIKLQN